MGRKKGGSNAKVYPPAIPFLHILALSDDIDAGRNLLLVLRRRSNVCGRGSLAAKLS
jgi:hypothetical protein